MHWVGSPGQVLLSRALALVSPRWALSILGWLGASRGAAVVSRLFLSKLRLVQRPRGWLGASPPPSSPSSLPLPSFFFLPPGYLVLSE